MVIVITLLLLDNVKIIAIQQVKRHFRISQLSLRLKLIVRYFQACASGQIALKDTATQALISCQTAASTASGCPSGYSCITASLLGANVCCGSDAPVGTCPAGQFAFMDSFTSTPLQCIQNTDGQCPITPNRYTCQPSLLQSGANFCCATTVGL